MGEINSERKRAQREFHKSCAAAGTAKAKKKGERPEQCHRARTTNIATSSQPFRTTNTSSQRAIATTNVKVT